MKILLINFSSRKLGNCNSITKFIEDNLKDEIKSISFSSLSIKSCGDCNYECFNKRLDCPFISDDVYELYEEICKSDLVYFIIPNYCDYPCSNFFKFNERSLCYFSGMSNLLEKYESINKRYIVISNTEKDNFIKVFNYHSRANLKSYF